MPFVIPLYLVHPNTFVKTKPQPIQSVDGFLASWFFIESDVAISQKFITLAKQYGIPPPRAKPQGSGNGFAKICIIPRDIM